MIVRTKIVLLTCFGWLFAGAGAVAHDFVGIVPLLIGIIGAIVLIRNKYEQE